VNEVTINSWIAGGPGAMAPSHIEFQPHPLKFSPSLRTLKLLQKTNPHRFLRITRLQTVTTLREP
jgi:hypothetical protein